MLERSWKKRGSSTKVALQDLLDLSVLAFNGLSPITERDFRPNQCRLTFITCVIIAENFCAVKKKVEFSENSHDIFSEIFLKIRGVNTEHFSRKMG